MDDYLQTCLVFAARYAHTRKTAASFVVTQTILANWNRLDEKTQTQLVKEADEATCNFEDWRNLKAKGVAA